MRNPTTDLFDIAERAAIDGVDLVETPTRDGGILVDEITLQCVADLQTVAEIGFDGSFQNASGVFLQVLKNAQDVGDDIFEAGRDWLDGWLDLKQ